VSARRDIDPHTPGAGDENDDPTGVRALLSALPDPGPMPPELIRRISDSLAAEQGAHDGRALHSGSTDGYAPVTGPSRVTTDPSPVPGAAAGARSEADETPGDRAAGDGADDGATIHPFRPHRAEPDGHRTALRRLPAIAIAASVVVLAGAMVLGLVMSRGGLAGSDSMDVAATMSGADARPEGQSQAGGAADSAESSEAAESMESSESGPSMDSDAGAALAASPVSFYSSGAVITTANLVGHAKAVRGGSTGVVDQASEAVMTASPVGTPDGAADCIAVLLDLPSAQVTGLLTAVDFVRYDGTDAALIVVRDPLEGSPSGDQTGPGAVGAEASTAYLVPVDCGEGRAWTLRPPVRLDP
jgi:hypothetical protein